jgi:CRISPR-associated protein Cas2
MYVVTCYDIPDNRRRNQIAQVLEGFGYRVQESVFECEATSEQFSKMKQRISKKAKPDEDSIRYYILCADCVKRVELFGLGELKKPEPFFVV